MNARTLLVAVKPITWPSLAVALLALAAVGASAATVRSPAVAGAFYPDGEDALRRQVEGFLKAASPSVPPDLAGKRPAMLVVPHAGYVYSGATAAQCYKLLIGTPRPSRVIVLGPPHTMPLRGRCSIADYDAFSTPLGEVAVDSAACEKLASHRLFRKGRTEHAGEHCLEVQLPFLQTIWPDTPPIVPVLVGQLSVHDCRSAAGALAEVMDGDSLLIVSTDFTHYGTRFGFAPFQDAQGEALRGKIRGLDLEAVRYLERRDPQGFADFITARGATICGATALTVLLQFAAASDGVRPVFLKWANSGQATGSYSDCVSYVAMAFYAEPAALAQARAALGPSADASSLPPGAPALTADEKRALLRLAREAIQDPGSPSAEPARASEALRAPYGAFVTLKEHDELRGCVGQVIGTGPLWHTVADVARAAAFRDRRFTPLAPAELGEVTVEISVLGPLRLVRDVAEVTPGRDGLVVEQGLHSGVLLPQVATEQGWAARQFLEQTCRKAGLPEDAWQDERTRVYAFAATVFDENGHGL